MKKLLIILSVLLTLTACNQESLSTLAGTQWEYISTQDDLKINLNLISSTQGGSAFSEHLYPINIGVEYRITYQFNGINFGTITFIKDYMYPNIPSEITWYADTLTTSFYTYADNNKMIIYNTPHSDIGRIELTRK